jgi:SAM-dependent methyltransferase
VAADLGAGTGWLSFRLARAGYRVLAIEASLNGDFGLQAAEVYRAQAPEQLLPVQGDLEHPPLAQGKTSLLLLNASLHYANDLARTLQRAAATLRPKGCLVVIDTPVARRPQPGTGMGDRHLGREELEHALLSAGLLPCWIRIPRSWRWWVRQLKAKLAGDALFSFPIIRACRAD